jgi:hypothetical protein
MSSRRSHALILAAAGLAGLVCTTRAEAQTFTTVGTRAAGMGGAFVAVADDASAAYWNPAGFAGGSFFSLVLDRASSKADPEGWQAGQSQSGFLVALGVPALGLSYYRLRGTSVVPATAEAEDGRHLNRESVRLDSLVTHHAGVTLVQSVARGVAVGATLKMVRGVAGSEARPGDSGPDLLDEAASLMGRASNAFDADVGVMASTGAFKVGLTVRNLFEPSFEAAAGGRLGLDRQARVGVAVMPVEGWLVAADLDLLTAADAAGHDRREMALGAEGRLGPRAFVRAGGRLDTRGEGPGGRAATVSVGGSYAVMGGVLVDGHVTAGSRWGGRGWGLAARFVY